jgi:hypothetical protein
LRLMMLVLSIVLGIIPLLGVVWIFVSGMIALAPPSATVDGLFMTLILLALSLCFLLNAYWEMRDQGMLAFLHKSKEAAPASVPAPPPAAKSAASKTN